MSNADAEKALQVAGNAVEAMNCYGRWEKAVRRVQLVMDIVSPIAEVRSLSGLLLLY
jgi:hypothetical protein